MRAAQYQAPCPTDDVAAGGLYPDAAPATPEYTVAPADAAAAEPETPAYPADYTGAPVDAAAGLYDTPTPCPSDEVLAAGGDEYVAPEQEAELPALDGGYPDALGAGAPCPETETPVEYDDDVADLGADLYDTQAPTYDDGAATTDYTAGENAASKPAAAMAVISIVLPVMVYAF